MNIFERVIGLSNVFNLNSENTYIVNTLKTGVASMDSVLFITADEYDINKIIPCNGTMTHTIVSGETYIWAKGCIYCNFGGGTSQFVISRDIIPDVLVGHVGPGGDYTKLSEGDSFETCLIKILEGSVKWGELSNLTGTLSFSIPAPTIKIQIKKSGTETFVDYESQEIEVGDTIKYSVNEISDSTPSDPKIIMKYDSSHPKVLKYGFEAYKDDETTPYKQSSTNGGFTDTGLYSVNSGSSLSKDKLVIISKDNIFTGASIDSDKEKISGKEVIITETMRDTNSGKSTLKVSHNTPSYDVLSPDNKITLYAKSSKSEISEDHKKEITNKTIVNTYGIQSQSSSITLQIKQLPPKICGQYYIWGITGTVSKDPDTQEIIYSGDLKTAIDSVTNNFDETTINSRFVNIKGAGQEGEGIAYKDNPTSLNGGFLLMLSSKYPNQLLNEAGSINAFAGSSGCREVKEITSAKNTTYKLYLFPTSTKSNAKYQSLILKS